MNAGSVLTRDIKRTVWRRRLAGGRPSLLDPTALAHAPTLFYSIPPFTSAIFNAATFLHALAATLLRAIAATFLRAIAALYTTTLFNACPWCCALAIQAIFLKLPLPVTISAVEFTTLSALRQPLTGSLTTAAPLNVQTW